MDGIGLEGVKPIPGMSVGPEGRKEGEGVKAGCREDEARTTKV